MESGEPDESGTFTLKIKSKSDEHEGTQRKTFTKWINSQLGKASSDVRVVNLFDDLRDGTMLLTLLEVLSGKKMRRERGHLRVHHLNNVNNAMTTLENYNIKLVGISNNDIVDGNPKITLGLLWNIISHFQLLNALQSLMADFQGTPEEALLRWCRQSTKDYSNVSINNFTTSWKDGLAFNALIHRYRPDLLKFDNLSGKSASYNCDNAFNIGRDKLGVERLLDPEDVTRDRPDKKSIMMYVAMLYNKLSPNTALSTLSSGDAKGALAKRDPYQRSAISSTTSTLSSGDANGVLATRDPYQRSAISSTSTSRTMQSTQVSSTVKRTVTSSYSSSSSSDVKRSKVVTQSTSNGGEPNKYITSSESTSYIREKPVQQTSTSVVEHVLRDRPDSFYNDSDSIRNSIGSFKDSESNRDSVGDPTWDDYNSNLQEVLLWLSKAENKLKSQPSVSRNVDVVKDQFHEHEDFMMELTSHQASVGGVLEYGNQLISEGLASEKEENEIRDQMITLNERWESLRISAMERQTSLHENLMKLQQQQIEQLANWLDKSEGRIERSNDIGADIEAVKKQVENHKVFQEDLENQQQQVNSLTHMVVVVDDAAGENATADLEEQLAQLGDRWSSVCKWTEQRWIVLQDVLNNWQDYRDEERRLTKWLSEKSTHVENLKHVDLGDPDAIAHNLQKLVNLEHEMEAQQASFGTFNMAAERVAEHLDEESPGLDAIQDKMEEFNDQWNKITTEVSGRIALLKGLETKVQPVKSEMDEKTYWLNETEMALKSPKMNFDNDKMSSEELSRQYIVIESLESARNQRKTSVLAIQKKGDEIMEQMRSQGTIPVSFEHNLKAFNDRWETVSKMIDDKKHKASLARQRRNVVDINAKVEGIVKDAERFYDMMGLMPDNEYEIKSQLDQCKNKIDDHHSNERHLVKLKDLSRSLSKEDRQTPIFQLSVKRLDDRWTTVSSKIEDRKRQLTSLLESGPPKEYLNTMDTVLMSIKSAETSLGGDFHITEVGGLEDQIRRNKQVQSTLQEQKKNIDYLNTSADKFMKSLPRQKLEQIRSKLTDVNNKWKDVTMVIDKRQTQTQKAINQNKQFAEELKSLYKWISEVNDFLKDQQPAAGDPETLEAQLDQSEALQSDITKLQRKLDSLNETATYMLAKATPAYAQKLHEQQDDVTNCWDSLVRHANRVKDNLLAALEKYQKLNHDMKEMSHWITQTERSIADDDRDIANGEITKEKMDHYKELQQDVSKRAPVVVRINTTANQLADHTKQGTAKPLVESLKKLNSDWSRLKNKVAQRQHEFKITQSELEQFHMALQRDNKLVTEIDVVAEKSYDNMNGTEANLEDALRALNRHLSVLKMSGPGSVEDIANQLISKKISVTMVTRQRDDFLERLQAMKNRAERTKQVLEGELNKRQQMRKDFEAIKIWITKIEILITTRINRYEDIDERELKVLNEEFSSNEVLIKSVEGTCQELSQGPNGSTYANYLRELDQLRTKWVTIQTKFVELRDQPMKKLGTEFEALVGDVMSQLDKINRGAKKLKLVSGDPRDIKNLLGQCLSYKDDLVNMRKDVDHVKKVGFQIAEKSPEEKRNGIERRIEEVHQEHRELVNRVNKKHEDLNEALTLAGRIENEMTKLESWLEKTRAEAKRRTDAGFPEDVEEEIKWNKNTIKDVTGRLSEVQRLTEVGRELVDLSETGQLESLEDRLTHLNNTWEDLSSLLEHRLTLLPKYKTQIKDFERLVDQLNEWLDKMNKGLNDVRTDQPEAGEKLELLKEELHKHEPQFQIIRQNSNEFVSNGRHLMEPYRRLLDRRWEDLEAKISELEEELNTVKKGNVRSRIETEVIVKQRKMISRPGMTEEYIHMEERRSPDLSRPVVEETITTRRTFPGLHSAPVDDIDVRLETIIHEVKTLEELLWDIERPKERGVTTYEIGDKIKQAELRLNTLQPRVEIILRESKTVTASNSPNSEKIRHSLLDLSGRWLKACDEVDRNKRAVKLVPNWYQFRSNLEEISNSLKRYDGDDRPERYVKDLTAEEIEDQRRVYGLVVSDLEKLDREGVQFITPLEANKIKRRLREINSRFEQYQKPKDDTTAYRVVVHTGDVKDADTRAKVSLVVYGDSGRSSPEIRLAKSETYLTPFRRDQLDIFHSDQVKNLGDLTKVKVWHDNSAAKPAWNVRSIYVQDKKTGKVYHFDCNTWIGKDRPGESKDLKCGGFVLSPDGEDIFNRHRLANIQWQPYHFSTTDRDGASTGWTMVEEMTKLSDEVKHIDATLNSPELQGADYEEFSSQEDKLKSIGDQLEGFETKASNVFKRSETLTHEQCSNDKEYDAVKKAVSNLRLDWNNVNKDYKVRMVRWEKAQTVWRSYHCDLKDLSSWLNRVERILADTKMPNGDLNVDAAMSEQRSLEDGVSTHETVINSVNTMGEDIIRQSSAVEAKMFRDKLTGINRRWETVVAEVDDRKNRFKEEEMQIQEFMEESGDLLQWMDETDAVLKFKDASPSDGNAMKEQLAKVKEAERDIEMKDDSVKSMKQTGERLLTKTIFSKPNHDMVRTRLDLVLARWEILRMDGLSRRRGVENKLNRLNQFLNELDELSVWASTTRDLLETQVNLKEAGNTDEMVIDPKTVQESLRARQQTRDQINETMTILRRDSKLDSSAVPKTTENKVKTLNEDWARIASQASDLFAYKIREDVVVVEAAQTHEASIDGWDTRASPWPKFDKAVSELHIWLDDVTDMMKAEKVVLSDSEEIFALAEKQKSVAEQLKSKQHLLDEIAEMGHSLSEEADTKEDKLIIENKVGKLKEHWETVQDDSTVWRGQIDFLLEEWKRYVELREELVEWLRKAEAYLKKEENPYNYTVSDLDEQINKHKGFEEDLETWRGSISAVTQCGDNLIKEFPTYEASALRHNMSELQERWDNVKNKSDGRRVNLKDAFERMVRFHEEMINALTWLTMTESTVAELDTMIDASHCEEDRDKVEDLKVELNNIEEEINTHQETFASLNENGQHMVTEMEAGDVLTAVQSKLDDINDRWQSLNSRTLDMHDRLEETSTEWRQLLLDLQEIIEWINRADQDITSQHPIGGDLEAVQSQNETHQAFKGKLNVRRLVVDRVLDSGHRMMDEYHGERAAGEAEGSSRLRIAGNIDKQLKNVDDQWSKLCQRSEEWQKNVDDSLRKFQALQIQMEDVDVQLTEAEHARVTWTPIQDLVIESLHEQMDELKMLQERIANLQQMFENMSNTEGELRRRGVDLSANLQNRIDQLYRRWKQLQIQMLQRQNALQDAYPEGDSTSLQALQASVDPPWERAVAVNKVPYYINHKTETTQWDHPKMTELYHQIAELNDIKYSAYRTAMKLRAIQKATNLDLVTLENLDSAFESHGLHRQSNNNLIGISDMVQTLTTVYDNIEVGQENINTAICIDLTLNWLLNVYDSGRIGKIRLLSFKVGLVTMCRAHLEAKYKYLYRLVADNDGYMEHKQLGLLLHDSLQIPRQLGEIAAFGGSNIEPSVRSCFEKVGAKDRIDAPQFLTWLSAEPQSVVWLPTLHRLAASETVKHKAKCNICKEYPIVGFRFRCLKCFNYDLCQSCFWSGRVSHDHRLTHPMHQYCLSTTSGEDVKDFLSIVRNKFKKRQYKKNPPKKLGYLPIQTVMEGGNLETPPNPALQQNVSSEVHNRLGMYANRLAEAETNGGKYSPKQLDEEHQLIAQYCQSLKGENGENAPRSPTQIVLSLDADEKEDLESEINKLEDENRALQEEYERLKQIRDQEHPSEGDSSPGSTSRDAELLTEAKLLRQHKGRLEARMQVLEDHNKQLEAQLQRLRQLLDQPNQDNRSPPAYSRGTTPASSASSLGDHSYSAGRPGRQARPRGLESDTESEQGMSVGSDSHAVPLETRKSE